TLLRRVYPSSGRAPRGPGNPICSHPAARGRQDRKIRLTTSTGGVVVDTSFRAGWPLHRGVRPHAGVGLLPASAPLLKCEGGPFVCAYPTVALARGPSDVRRTSADSLLAGGRGGVAMADTGLPPGRMGR